MDETIRGHLLAHTHVNNVIIGLTDWLLMITLFEINSCVSGLKMFSWYWSFRRARAANVTIGMDRILLVLLLQHMYTLQNLVCSMYENKKFTSQFMFSLFPEIMLFFLNHQSLHCQVKKYWNISLNITTLQWTSKHSLYHLDFYFCCLFWRPTPAPSLTGITSHKPGVVQLKWTKMAFVNGTKNVILMSDQWSVITVWWLSKIIWNLT